MAGLETLKDGLDVYLLVLKPGEQGKSLEATKIMIDQGIKAVYVSVNKPYNTILNNAKKLGIDASKLLVLDAVSKATGSPTPNDPSVIYISNPTNLSEMSITIGNAIKQMGTKNVVVVFDNASLMYVYSKKDIVSKFFRFLIAQARKDGQKVILIAIKDDESGDIINEFSQVCDETVEI
ncbi:MAG TPA: ATPase domain-containing protein [archaeon]|nr:ATPase domain-containing protein [archaeon]